MNKNEIKARIAEIETIEEEYQERQYKYGYIFPHMLQAELYQEKKQLKARLAAL